MPLSDVHGMWVPSRRRGRFSKWMMVEEISVSSRADEYSFARDDGRRREERDEVDTRRVTMDFIELGE
jgi:hypothetical protein